MKQLHALLLVLLMACMQVYQVNAQSTYAQVYQLINSKCSNTACHDGSTPTFNARLSSDSLYTAIINATPVNPAAGAIYNKIVVPGDVQRSFLLRKIAHGISDGLKLNQPSEGLDMPQGLPALANTEIELIRQWIMYGAPKTGSPVDTALINTYYRNGGIDDTYSPHAPLPAGQGIQIYLGRIFLPKDTEVEYFCKYDPHFAQATEANAIYSYMPANLHHFIMWLFQAGTSTIYAPGIRQLDQASMEHDLYGVPTAPGYWSYLLPQNSAFFYPQGTMFDLDVHIQNPSVDSVYSSDLYVNIATQPVGTASKYMQVLNYPNLNISIPEDGQPHTFPIVATDSSQTQYWNIWKLMTHTHKYGTGFDVYMRNADGSMGSQIYDGNYSYEEGFNTGYYRWGPHVTIRTWPADSLLVVNPFSGLLGEGTFINTAGPNPVVWGFSSAAEMEDVTFFYVPGDNLSATGINTPNAEQPSVKVFPNPATNDFLVSYSLPQPQAVEICLYDITGNKVSTLVNNQAADKGSYAYHFNPDALHLQAGVYFVNFSLGGKTVTEKLVVTE